jgi:NodT family efflux transporter outer membrane factor (OMF) lipoprotein
MFLIHRCTRKRFVGRYGRVNSAGKTRSHQLISYAGQVGFLVIAAAMVVFTGCTTSPSNWIHNGFKVGPNYCPPPAPVADRWIDADAPQVLSEPVDYCEWWSVFDDPILNDLVYVASQQNLSLQAAGARILEARAVRGVTAGNLFPQQQQAYGSYERRKISPDSVPLTFSGFPPGISPTIIDEYDWWRAGFDAAWELDVWGKLRRSVEAADARLNSEIEGYHDVLVMLQAEVAANYIRMRTLEERIELARQNANLQRKILDKLEIADEINALRNKLDLHQAQSELANLKAAIPSLEIEHRKTQNRLCVLLGIPLRQMQDELSGPSGAPTVPEYIVVGIPADLLRRRPDVRRAEREAAAQCANIGVAEADLYPQFSITGTIGIEARQFAALFDATNIAAAASPGFRWNILNYGRIRNNIRAEEARLCQLTAAYQESVLRANEEVENGIVSYLREQERLKFLDESVRATQLAYDMSLDKYELGDVSYQRLLESQRSLVLRQDRLAQTRGDVALHLVTVYKALGGGW